MGTLISPHFCFEEFACHDGTPYPAEWIDERLRPLGTALERLRAELGERPVHIVSGFRSPSHNAAVRGAKKSQHVAGRAADFTVAGVTPAKVHAALLRLFRAAAVDIGGLGL